MDLGDYNIPNSYGLLAADFGHDMDSYRAALGFLGDVSCGVQEEKALADNGGTPTLLVAWEGIQKFRRVFGKVRQMGADEREHEARKREEQEDPFRTPPRRGRFWDPFRRGQRPSDATPAYLKAFGEAAHAITAARDGERAPPGGQRFVSFEDMTPQQAAAANAQQQPNMRPRGQAGGMWDRKADPASFPWPSDSSGEPLGQIRGEVSLVPGVGPVNVKPGGK